MQCLAADTTALAQMCKPCEDASYCQLHSCLLWCVCALLQHGKAAHEVLYEMHVNCFGYKCWDGDVGC